jgi:hypothetical protein
MKIISGIFILITVFLNIRHGWAGLMMKPETISMMEEMGIGKQLSVVVSVLTLAGACLVLFPQTFFIGNLLNAVIILLIMCLALQAGNIKSALIEIPFLLMPLVMIWLKHPFS